MYMVAQSSAKTVWIHKYKLSMSKWRSVLSSRAEVRSLPMCHLSFTRTQIMSKLPIRGDDRDSALLREQDIAQPKPSFPSLTPSGPVVTSFLYLSFVPPSSRWLNATLGNPEHQGFQPDSDHEKAKWQRLRNLTWWRSEFSAALLSDRQKKQKKKPNKKKIAHLCTLLAAAQLCLENVFFTRPACLSR